MQSTTESHEQGVAKADAADETLRRSASAMASATSSGDPVVETKITQPRSNRAAASRWTDVGGDDRRAGRQRLGHLQSGAILIRQSHHHSGRSQPTVKHGIGDLTDELHARGNPQVGRPSTEPVARRSVADDDQPEGRIEARHRCDRALDAPGALEVADREHHLARVWERVRRLDRGCIHADRHDADPPRRRRKPPAQRSRSTVELQTIWTAPAMTASVARAYGRPMMR